MESAQCLFHILNVTLTDSKLLLANVHRRKLSSVFALCMTNSKQQDATVEVLRMSCAQQRRVAHEHQHVDSDAC